MIYIKQINNLWEKKPLLVIMLLAILFRVLAAIFSKGFGMLDDHFQVIEVAQGWLEGKDMWLNAPDTIHRSLVYPGLHYILFSILESIGITDPQLKMTFVRFIHASYSLLIVLFGYLITKQISDIKTARKVGLVLALFWILPFMSVRNLVEVVCIPPIMIGFYFTLKEENSKNWYISGLFFGLSFVFRYQIFIIIGGVIIVLIVLKKFRILAIFTAGLLTSILLVEGLVNLIVWGSPFSPIINYVTYNIRARYGYVTGPWYSYLLLLLGVLIPPASIFMLYGFLRSWKKWTILFWPTFLFLIFHSYFPNKQERFILPILPLLIILGFAGFEEYVKKSRFWQTKDRLLKGCWLWFWVINIILLIVVTFTYSKKNRIETLYYLSSKQDIEGIIWESHHKATPFIPVFYLNQDIPFYKYPQSRSTEEIKAEIISSGNPPPNYIVFLGEKGIEHRIQRFEEDFSSYLMLETKVSPSFIDAILYKLNPSKNVNQLSYIYKIRKP